MPLADQPGAAVESTIVFDASRFSLVDAGSEHIPLRNGGTVEIHNWKNGTQQVELIYAVGGYIVPLVDRIEARFPMPLETGTSGETRNHIGIVEFQQLRIGDDACVYFRQHIGETVLRPAHMAPPADFLEGIYCEITSVEIPLSYLRRVLHAYGLRHLGIEPAPATAGG